MQLWMLMLMLMQVWIYCPLMEYQCRDWHGLGAFPDFSTSLKDPKL